MELVVRELVMGDIPKVANVYIKAYAEEDWNEQWACKDAAQRIYEIISSPHCKGGICVLNEEVIGCILFEILTWHTGKQLEIKEIFVIPSFQRQGIGKKLLEYMECGTWTQFTFGLSQFTFVLRCSWSFVPAYLLWRCTFIFFIRSGQWNLASRDV